MTGKDITIDMETTIVVMEKDITIQMEMTAVMEKNIAID
jgi:hypothetical protein